MIGENLKSVAAIIMTVLILIQLGSIANQLRIMNESLAEISGHLSVIASKP